jgi:diguanylate cyclase (GGDEF)-like protein
MALPKVLWLGATRGLAPHALAVEGFGLEVRQRVPETLAADLCVLVASERLRVPAVRALLPAVKIVAVVPDAGAIGPALAAGADDALTLAAAASELPARVRTWSRMVLVEKQLEATRLTLETRTQELERTRAQLRAALPTDSLTGLGNRRSFVDALEAALEFTARYDVATSVVLIELDGLAAITAGFGAEGADTARVCVAEIVSGAVRFVDHAARLGRDELGLVLPATPAAAAQRVAERIRDLVCAALPVGGLPLSVSLGVAAAQDARSADVVRRAGAALHAAKQGTNQVVVDGAAKLAAA